MSDERGRYRTVEQRNEEEYFSGVPDAGRECQLIRTGEVATGVGKDHV